MKAEIRTVTPEEAKLLLQNNSNNRAIRQKRVESYAKDMINGNWNLTGQGITIDKNGQILDGQHRLSAIVLANKPIEMLVVTEADRCATYDAGLVRSNLDKIKLGREINSNGGAISTVGLAIIRNYYILVLYGYLNSRVDVSISEIEGVLDADTDELNWISTVFQSGGKQAGVRRVVVPATLFAIHKLDDRLTKEMIEHIAYVLYTGFTSDATDMPILALRNKLVSGQIATSGAGNGELELRVEYMVDALLKGRVSNMNGVPKSHIWNFTKLQKTIV